MFLCFLTSHISDNINEMHKMTEIYHTSMIKLVHPLSRAISGDFFGWMYADR